MIPYHTLLTGSSGGGKTSKAREWHDTAQGCSLFLTTKDDEGNVTGKPVRGRRALDSAVAKAREMTDVRCKWLGASYDADLRIARAWARDVWEYRGWPVQIIVDECSESGLAKGEGPINEGLRKDRDHGIKWVPATQDPQDLEQGYGAIKQCEWVVWCGPLKTFHKGFRIYYNLPRELFPTERYETVTFELTDPPQVAHRGRTKKRYS